MKVCIILCLLLLSTHIHSQPQPLNTKNQHPIYGHWDVSIGAHFWYDHFKFRNMQFRNITYISNNLRLTNVIRSNAEMDSIKTIAPKIDESFLQWFNTKTTTHSQLDSSLKIGEMRYLRFPKPDLISLFDQVPGIEDLQNKFQTSYRGILINQEIVMHKKWGYHYSFMTWLFSHYTGSNFIESYLFYKNNHSNINIELRVGYLARRIAPLGLSSFGYSGYIGLSYLKMKAGVLYEYLQEEGIRTGILVEFNKNPINQLLGKIRADYTRSPEGFGLQPTLLKGTYGATEHIPKNAIQIGQRIVEQTTTYWQNGQGRNFYEHILHEEGITSGKNILIHIEEKPYYLKIESLVSLYNKFQTWDDLVEWEKNRQGPAQISKIIIYKYYKLKE